MYDFGIIGGDIRQMYVAEYLAAAGYSVFCYGVENMSENGAKNIDDVLNNSDIIIAPIPYSKDGKNLSIRNSYKRIENWRFASMIPEGKIIFSGALSKDTIRIIKEKGGTPIDILCNPIVEKYNTIATAEGTIAEAIISHPGFIKDSMSVVLGYGKCGRQIADCLCAMGADVTVCARRSEIRAQAKEHGYEAIDFCELSHQIENFEYIFNTVPELVLDECVLRNVRENAIIIDIASMPGGVDFETAEKLNIRCRHCLGLPGKYCPGALAKIYVEQILDSINKL